MNELVSTMNGLSNIFEELLAVLSLVDEEWVPPKSERTPGWYSKFQVRCDGCGRFASVLRSGDGYTSCDGTYEPWFEIECKKCGVRNGYIAYD